MMRRVCPVIFAGGFAFWGCYWLVRVIMGGAYGGKAVGFLTLAGPVATWILAYLWLYSEQSRATSAMTLVFLIGAVGPLVLTVVQALIFGIALDGGFGRGRSIGGLADYLASLVTLGSLSFLTYTGMLGALVVAVAAAPVLGWCLSPRRKPGGACGRP